MMMSNITEPLAFSNWEHIVNIQEVIKKLIGEFEIDISAASP